MCVKLNSLIDREMTVFYVTHVLTSKRCVHTTYQFSFATICCKSNQAPKPRYKMSSKIKSVKLQVIVVIVFKLYRKTYFLLKGSRAICNSFLNLKVLPQSKPHNLLQTQFLSCIQKICFVLTSYQHDTYLSFKS